MNSNMAAPYRNSPPQFYPGWPSPPMSPYGLGINPGMQQLPTGISAAHLALILDRLSRWAGFNRMAALAQLQDVISLPLIDWISMESQTGYIQIQIHL